MAEKPLVSIGMPVYKGANFIRESMEVLLGQTYTNLQIIISDNASPDETPDICREYAARDPRVQFEPNTINIGAVPNYNRALSFAKGKYFRWAAHDDLCSLDSVERCVEALEADPAVLMAHPEDNLIDDHGQPLPLAELQTLHADQASASDRFRHYMDVIWFQPWDFRVVHPVFGLMRTDVLKQMNGVGEGFCEDLIMLGELVLRGKAVEVKGTYFSRRIHSHQIEAVGWEKSIYELAVAMNPKQEGKWLLHWPVWKRLLNTVNNVPLTRDERTEVDRELMRWFLQYGAPAMARNLRDEIKRRITSSKN